MSTPENGGVQPWHQPGGSTGSGYGQPSSPSYGKYGQGQALPVPPPPPPGQQPPGPQPAWGQPGYVRPQPQQQYAPGRLPTSLQTVSGLVPAVFGLSGLMGVVICVSSFLVPNQHQAFVDAMNGIRTTADPGTSAYGLTRALGLLVYIGIWVITSLWLTKVRQNAVFLRPQGQRRSESWIWLAWIIPIVNLWFPKQVVDDAIAATAGATGEPRLRTGLWWTAWISAAVLSLGQGILSLFPPNDAVQNTVGGLTTLVTVVALVSWLRIVHWLSARQDALAAPPSVGTLPG